MGTAQQIKRQLEKALNLDAQFWRNEIGFKILRKEPPKDAKIGLMQNNKQKLPYFSKQYVKYKANNMRRFTKGGTAKSFDPSHDYPGKRLYGSKTATSKGGRLSGYEGIPIVSKQTQFVDMTLTGRMWKGLTVKKADKNSVTMTFDPADKGKIIGNRRYGREVVGINDKNKMLVKNAILKKLDRNLKAQLSRTIKIKVT